MRTSLTAVFLALAPLATPIQAQQPSLFERVLAAERAVSDSSAAGSFAAALTGAMTPDAAYLHVGAPVILGAARARAFLAAHTGLAGLTVQWQALHAEISADSTLAVTWGVATARTAAGPGPMGKYLAAWAWSDGTWRLAAVVFMGVLPPATPASIAGLPLTTMPAPATGLAAPFVTADLAVSALAGRSGAAVAFHQFAADDAVTFRGNGLLTMGRAAIRASLAGNAATWRWHPVAAGAAASGDLGFTVGESEISARTPEGGRQTYHGKYLTLWRRERGATRFIADGGGARPAPTAASR